MSVNHIAQHHFKDEPASPCRMRTVFLICAATGLCALSAPVYADASASFEPRIGAGDGKELPPYLQCVPYARQLSGVQIYGDAHTWWGQAEGRYARGNEPRIGAVMAFEPHGSMRLGHVATVSRVIDRRTVLLDHANWSPINGRRGQIERNVKAIDVSPNNDWSQVRVWYDPIEGLGTTPWPVHGFIYSEKPNLPAQRLARAPARQPESGSPVAESHQPPAGPPSRAFLTAFADMTPAPMTRQSASAPTSGRVQALPQRKAMPKRKEVSAVAQADPIARAVARYSN
ncbi:CHAP protein [Pelagerythrobacter marensis]|uniref:CHAP protein n=2 Tax=Pelagerythrobacter marensis TaxID=543877 RepID=A0A0G3X702_9SPHN|nr:CHAP protein [Pelagerythrobacter marensis]